MWSFFFRNVTTNEYNQPLSVFTKKPKNVAMERVQQLTGPRISAIFLDRSAVGQLSAKRPGNFSSIDF